MNGLQVSKTHLQEWAELLIQIFRLQYFMIYRSGVLHSWTLWFSPYVCCHISSLFTAWWNLGSSWSGCSDLMWGTRQGASAPRRICGGHWGILQPHWWMVYSGQLFQQWACPPDTTYIRVSHKRWLHNKSDPRNLQLSISLWQSWIWSIPR